MATLRRPSRGLSRRAVSSLLLTLGITVGVLVSGGGSTIAASRPDRSAHVRWVIVRSQDRGTWSELNAITAPLHGSVWAAGTSFWLTDRIAVRPLVERWDDGAWQVVTVPRVRGRASLYGIAGSANGSLWAVGAVFYPRSELTGGLILRWDGNRWRRVPFPTPRISYGSLSFNAVDAVSETDALAVGTRLGRSGLPGPLVERWNGTEWRVMRVPRPSDRGDASLSAVTHVPHSGMRVAVGGVESRSPMGGEGRKHPLIEMFDGSRWRPLPSPTQRGTLRAVVGVSVTDVWAVGDSAARTPQTGQPLILHWNGASWQTVPSPVLPGHGELDGVAGTRRDLWAVGRAYDQLGNPAVLVEHWDGRRWTIGQAPTPSGGGGLAGVTATRHAYWAAGSSEAISTLTERTARR